MIELPEVGFSMVCRMWNISLILFLFAVSSKVASAQINACQQDQCENSESACSDFEDIYGHLTQFHQNERDISEEVPQDSCRVVCPCKSHCDEAVLDIVIGTPAQPEKTQKVMINEKDQDIHSLKETVKNDPDFKQVQGPFAANYLLESVPGGPFGKPIPVGKWITSVTALRFMGQWWVWKGEFSCHFEDCPKYRDLIREDVKTYDLIGLYPGTLEPNEGSALYDAIHGEEQPKVSLALAAWSVLPFTGTVEAICDGNYQLAGAKLVVEAGSFAFSVGTAGAGALIAPILIDGAGNYVIDQNFDQHGKPIQPEPEPELQEQGATNWDRFDHESAPQGSFFRRYGVASNGSKNQLRSVFGDGLPFTAPIVKRYAFGLNPAPFRSVKLFVKVPVVNFAKVAVNKLVPKFVTSKIIPKCRTLTARFKEHGTKHLNKSRETFKDAKKQIENFIQDEARKGRSNVTYTVVVENKPFLASVNKTINSSPKITEALARVEAEVLKNGSAKSLVGQTIDGVQYSAGQAGALQVDFVKGTTFKLGESFRAAIGQGKHVGRKMVDSFSIAFERGTDGIWQVYHLCPY